MEIAYQIVDRPSAAANLTNVYNIPFDLDLSPDALMNLLYKNGLLQRGFDAEDKRIFGDTPPRNVFHLLRLAVYGIKAVESTRSGILRQL